MVYLVISSLLTLVTREELQSSSHISGKFLMDTYSKVSALYMAALDDEGDDLKKFCNKEDAYRFLFPVTVARDFIWHLAVFSNGKEQLEYFLDIAKKNPPLNDSISEKNKYGNTALHEAAANGNLEAVKLLVEYYNQSCNDGENTEFLEDINGKGETPLFKAAEYGKTKVVKFLASEPFKQLIKEVDYEITETGEIKTVEVTQLKDIHRQIITLIKKKAKPEPSKPPTPLEEETIKVHGASILHVAIRGEYFETALLLLELDKGLAALKDENGWTSLHLLASMPCAFRSGYRMATWISRVFYFCLPIDNSIDDEMGSRFNHFKGIRFGDDVDDKELCCLNLFKGW